MRELGWHRRSPLSLVAWAILLAMVAALPACQRKSAVQAETVSRSVEPPAGKLSPLPLPSSLGVAEYEERLFKFLNERTYQALGWAPDKMVRDTGPFINGKYYGTHPAVRVYYSPEIIAWLRDGKRGAIPDGAMIIKEQ